MTQIHLWLKKTLKHSLYNNAQLFRIKGIVGKNRQKREMFLLEDKENGVTYIQDFNSDEYAKLSEKFGSISNCIGKDILISSDKYTPYTFTLIISFPQ